MRSNDSQKIIAVGIPKSMDDAGLSELFSGFGAVAEAKVVLDAATNASRGFGFVTFTASAAMRAAVKGMDKKKVEGRVLNVRQLVPKDKFQQQKQSDESAAADPSKRPCWLLRKGKCTKGDSCPFSHETQGGEFGSCFEFVQTGACKRGDACKFYHPPATEESAEGDADKDSSSNSSKPKAVVNDKAKGKAGEKSKGGDKPTKRVCYAFQSGRCHRGKSCLFAHEKLPADAAPEAKQAAKKSAAPVKKPGDFEVVASGDAGRKRTRDEMEGEDSETSSEDDAMDDVVAKPQPQPPHKTATKPQPKPVRNATKPVRNMTKPTATASPNKPREVAAKAAPLAGLAAHVSSFMQQQPAVKPMASTVAPVEDARTSEQPQRRREGPPPSVKRQKTERIDMGAAFDSDDDAPRSTGPKFAGRKPMDKEAMKAAREKAKEDRRAKRLAKKQALSRLRTDGKVDLEATA